MWYISKWARAEIVFIQHKYYRAIEQVIEKI